jgi:hypothetical protein
MLFGEYLGFENTHSDRLLRHAFPDHGSHCAVFYLIINLNKPKIKI